ncbi:hypothetical protein [Paenibacillus beijingensis]|uniref:Uncharacterized protein n=1 Tax=Paenibacillus beijingensis TaxID=1126833 RepID=A0A0D5NIU9_9BACL|nr:hypothetical protein [Paenibacillus beijingensis]AJY74853.1 hypothetical protein VN24_09940 [Paenibacillus beijingensis]
MEWKEAGKKGFWLGLIFRVFAVIFAVSGLLMLQGLSEGLEPWVQGVMASSPLPDELRFHGAVHGALIGLLFSGSLIAMLWNPLGKPLLLQFYFVGHLMFLATLLLTDFQLALQTFFVFILFALVLLILFAAYGKRKEIFRPTEPSVKNRALLIMAGVALLGLLPFSINGVIGQFQDPEQQFRWGEGAALSIVMVYGGYLAATGRSGSRTLGVILSLTYIFLGAASITIPNHPGSWGLWGGTASILYGLIYIGLALRSKTSHSVSAVNAS